MKDSSQSLKMNGMTIEASPRSIMRNAFEILTRTGDFQYRSKENLIETLVEVRGLAIDWLKERKRSTKKYEKEQADIRRRGEHMTRAQVVQMAFNEVLRFQDLGTLRGFGLSNNFKDSIPGNPETSSITTRK